jgi:hypothetical protein
MFKSMRVAVLAGSIFAAAVTTARADDGCCSSASSDCCAPRTKKVCVKEWVNESYQATRTVYKHECKTETYTAYRCESVPEQRTRTCTVYKKVSCQEERCRKVCTMVPCQEQRTTYEKHWECVPECKVVRKCVDKGHYECKEVECGPSLGDRLHSLCNRNKCCDSGCGNNSCCEQACPRTKTVKCWVACPTWEEHTCTVNKKVCVTVPKTCTVTVCKPQYHEEKYTVTVCKCVPECKTETYTVCVEKKIPYQATRQVSVCVPVCETYTACRKVCHMVEKEVCCRESFCERMSHHFNRTCCHEHNDCCN